MRRFLVKTIIVLCLILLPFLTPQLISFAGEYGVETKHWSKARYDRTYLSPNPQIITEAVVQVLGARTWGWRGSFAIHTWISVKPKNGLSFIRYEVIGWRRPVLTIRSGVPDNYWAGSKPSVLQDIRGDDAEKIIAELPAIINQYPYKDQYTVWPGPNSNTFIAYIGRKIPELGLDLPPTAIGKDYLVGNNSFIGTAVSGQGVQFSALGYGGFAMSEVEGLELHLLGLTTGIDFNDLTLKLPGFGRITLFE